MNPIDIEEAKKYSECADCEQTLYVYNQNDYPEDTGVICFNCLAKRYAVLRDAKPSPTTKAVVLGVKSMIQAGEVYDNHVLIPIKLGSAMDLLTENGESL